MTEPITDDELLRAAKRRWGNLHLLVGRFTDGLCEHWYLAAETGNPHGTSRHLEIMAQGHTAAELLTAIELASRTNSTPPQKAWR